MRDPKIVASDMQKVDNCLRKQLFLARAQQAMLQTCLEDSRKPHALHTKFCISVYGSIKNYIERSTDGAFSAFCNDYTNGNGPSFVGVVQVITDKTATILILNAMLAYTVHIVALYFTAEVL